MELTEKIDTAQRNKKSQKPKPNEKKLKTSEEKAAEFKVQLEAFKSNADKSELRFPSSLNSHDRMVVHEVAKSLGLFHISEGEGSQRHILVSKHEILQDTTIEQSTIQDTTTSQDTGAAAATD